MKEARMNLILLADHQRDIVLLIKRGLKDSLKNKGLCYEQIYTKIMLFYGTGMCVGHWD